MKEGDSKPLVDQGEGFCHLGRIKLWPVNPDAVSLLLNLEAARRGRNLLFSDEQKLLFKGGKKGFVKNTKLDFMRR